MKAKLDAGTDKRHTKCLQIFSEPNCVQRRLEECVAQLMEKHLTER